MSPEAGVRSLVVGWFSFEEMGATAGDVIAGDLACEWLEAAGHEVEVAYAGPFEGGVDWRTADPERYDYVVFVCGPFGNGPPVTEFLEHFAGRPLIGLNLTVLDPLDQWNPFHLLVERDSSATARPDMTFLAPPPRAPVVGLVLRTAGSEYGDRNKHERAHAAARRLTELREMAVVPIDTRLDRNSTGLRTPGEVEALIARMDVIISTRLHGLVLGLKNGVPVVAIDSIEGQGKVTRQAETLGWPVRLTLDELDDETLVKAFDFCLGDEARDEARACRERAVRLLEEARDDLIAQLAAEANRAVRAEVS